MGRDEQRFSQCGKTAHHVPLGIQHQEAVLAGNGLADQVQHGLRLATADAAKDQEMPSLAFAPQRNGRYQGDAFAVDLALAGASLGKRLQASAADLQPRPAKNPHRLRSEAKAQGKDKQHQESDKTKTTDGPEPDLEPIESTILRQLVSAASPIGVAAAVPDPCQTRPLRQACRVAPGNCTPRRSQIRT
jgi:hypothetical protein